MQVLEWIGDFWHQAFVLLAFVAFILLLINYFLRYYPIGALKTHHLEKTDLEEPISLIICAKNEDENLTEFLPKVLTQDYPNFEVIVVNDCSYDNTETVIDEFIKIFPNLKKVTIQEDPYYKHGKKFAVLVGIKAASYENLLFTDADCYPASSNWLREMASGFSVRKEIVLGYGAYEKMPGFLNKLIRFDTFIIATQYLSAAVRKRPYMGVGRNLAYKKSLFYKNKGFSRHYHINSGDDDLFVNEAAGRENVNICVSKDAITYSKPKTSFKAWKLQKARHLTTSPFYKAATKTAIAWNYFTQYFFVLSLIPLFLSVNTAIIAGGLFLLKVFFQWFVTRKAAIKLNEPDLWLFSFFYELLLLLIYPIFHLAKITYKPNHWTN